MAEPIIVGRDSEIRFIEQRIQRALGGQPGMLLIAGEAGIGKSSLLHAVMARAAASHPEAVVAVGYCNAQLGQGDPLHPVREIAAQLFRRDDEEGAGTSPGRGKASEVLLEFLQEVGPDVVGLFLAPVGVGLKIFQVIGKMASAKRQPGESQSLGEQASAGRTALFKDFCTLLFRVSRKVPLVLIFEDLHWSDESTVEFLFHMARSWSNQPIFVLGTYRPDEVLGAEHEHPLCRVERELLRYNLCERLPLGWLSKDQLQAWVDQRYGGHRFPPMFISWLYARTEGNAFFVSELLKDLDERRLITRAGDGAWVLAPAVQGPQSLPASIAAVLEQRLARLEQRLYELLSCASVEGEDFTAEVIAAVRRVEPDRVLDDLELLARKRDLVSFKEEKSLAQQIISLFEFRHSLMRSHLYERLQPPQRRRLHQRIAECLEVLYAPQLDAIAAALAQHYTLAQNVSRGYHYACRAATWAEQVYDYRAACRWLRTASASIDQLGLGPAERADFWCHLGRVETWAGTFHDAERCFQLALDATDEAADREQRAVILDELSYCLIESNQSRRALTLLEEALTISRAAGAADRVARHLVNLSFAWHKLGRQDLTKVYLEQAAGHFAAEGDQAGLATVYRHLGVHYRVSRELEKSVQYLEEAARLDHARGNKFHEASDYTNLGSTYLLLAQDKERALYYYQRSLQLSRQIGKLFEEGHVLLNIARLYGLDGELARALAYASEGLRLAQLVKETSNIIRGHWYRALLHHTAGRLGEALADLEAALAIGVHDHHQQWALLYNLGSVRGAMGDLKGSLAAFRSAADVLLGVADELPPAERASYLTTGKRLNVLRALLHAARAAGDAEAAAWVTARAAARLPAGVSLESEEPSPRYYWGQAWR